MTPEDALKLVLDQVDYTNNACSPNEPVGGVLSRQVLELAKQALQPVVDTSCQLCKQGIIHKH